MEPTRRRRSLRLASILSVLVHLLGVWLVSLRAPECNAPKDPIGSEELDIDLVAPRLAPPIRHQGPADREGRGEGEQREAWGRRAEQGGGRPSSSASPVAARSAEEATAVKRSDPAAAPAAADPSLPLPAAAPVPRTSAVPRAIAHAARPATPRGPAAIARPATPPGSPERDPRSSRAAVSVAEGAADPLARRAPSTEGELVALQGELVALQGQPRRVIARTLTASSSSSGSSKREADASEALLRLYREAAAPEAPAPTAVLAAVQEEHRERRSRDLAFRREHRRRAAEATRQLASLDARVRRGSEESSGVIGAGPGKHGGAGEAARSRGGKSGSRYGLRFFLSGRLVESSRVVKPPEAIELPQIRCRVDRIDITPATVRMLVDKGGSVGLAYLIHSSSSRHFDRCAIRHARSIRFRPGHDGNGVPLSVWINVRVEPSLLTAGL